MRQRWLWIVVVVTAVVAAGAFILRPTPIVGTDGGSLSQSVNGWGFLGSAAGDCKRLEEDDGWGCPVLRRGGSATVRIVVAVDGLGCWHGVKIGGRSLAPGSKQPSGCVSLLDHLGAL